VKEFDDSYIWLKLRMRTLAAARAALKIMGLQLHSEARFEPDKMRASHLRAEGDHYIKQEVELQEAEMRGHEEDPNKGGK
jgi:hypothetical protein